MKPRILFVNGGVAHPRLACTTPERRKRQPGGQAWPKDKNGRNWPQDRWGRPMRPLWDYPPGVRAPGEGVAPGAPGSITTADAINAYLQAEAVFANPMGIRRAALVTPDPANLGTVVASDRTGTEKQTPQRGVASRYPGAYDVAQVGEGEGEGEGEEKRSEGELDPLSGARTIIYYSIESQIKPLNPHYTTITRGDDFRASEDDVQAVLAELAATRTRIAANIANGHAFAKHAAQFGVTTTGALQSVVEDVLSDPTTEVRTLDRGRSAFYNRTTHLLVIVGNYSPPGRDQAAWITASPARAARIAASAVRPCRRPVAITLAAAA